MDTHIHIKNYNKFYNNIATTSLLHFEVSNSDYNIAIESFNEFIANLCNEYVITIVYPSENYISEGS